MVWEKRKCFLHAELLEQEQCSNAVLDVAGIIWKTHQNHDFLWWLGTPSLPQIDVLGFMSQNEIRKHEGHCRSSG